MAHLPCTRPAGHSVHNSIAACNHLEHIYHGKQYASNSIQLKHNLIECADKME